METFYSKKIGSILKISVQSLFLLFSIGLQAQVNETDEEVPDSVKTGYAVGSLQMNNPPSILEAYTYDPVTDRYVYTNSVDGFNINYPIILTPKEYDQLVQREAMRNYFKKKSDAIDGKKTGAEEAKKDLLPRYYVNSGFFESIFGSNTIDVKPTGSVEIDLGMRYTKQDNPAFSPRNRTSTTFDFDQRISMSLQGKVGTRLSVNANYDTESTFAFQNLIKLEYTPTEDDIIQKIEVGNVSLPLNSSLIRGAQSLFGVKAQLQFGKTTVTGIFSEQKSQTKTVTAEGGATIQDFDMFALDYDADRHFFLSQYFRDKYDTSLARYPFINSRVQITRMEVWITNRQNRISTTNNNLRNIIALQDLGEAQLSDVPINKTVILTPAAIANNFFLTTPTDAPVDNKNNKYDPARITTGTGYLKPQIREISTANVSSGGFDPITAAQEGQDYSKLENARKLNTNEYTFNPQLGYISLQQKLANDEILAVAYQYTIGDQVYQVGEFGNDGVDATQAGATNPETGQPESITTQTLVLKLLKSNLTNVDAPIWNIMMKNIYQIPGAYQLEQEDFRFNILYSDPSPLNYISPVPGTQFPDQVPGNNVGLENRVSETPLLKVFNVDKLNYNNDPQTGGDGFFDFLPGLTVDTQNGRLIFTNVEPFGKVIFEKLRLSPLEDYSGTDALYNANQRKYVFQSLYRKTQAQALQDSEKNKYQLRGKFKSSGGDGIPIGAFNVPKGSVVVTAGGRVLVEGVDYSVNYQAGRVQILDPALQASNTPIEVSVENNSTFGQQTRRFMGINIEHKFSENFLIGATFLKMTERPFTQKSSYGQESVNNSIYGFNTNFSTEVPFLTRMVNKLPNIDTDVPSNFSFRGEVAFLKPDTPKTDQFDGESTLYVDDFEGSQTTIDLTTPTAWTISSTPLKNAAGPSAYPDFGGNAGDLSYGYKRAKMSWYSIDPIFYAQRPSGISVDDLSLNKTRRIYSEELYPNTTIAAGQLQVVNTLDLTYYPTERGPYNFNPAAAATGILPNPADNFGGIMRALNSTNFEQSNVEYIQFWMLDPYIGRGVTTDDMNNPGKIYFNLGSISEDILKDGKKMFENGLPQTSDNQAQFTPTIWGKIPWSQSLVYAFDTSEGNRQIQDVGLDGLSDAEEAAKYPAFAGLPDPAGDNYQYFINAETTGGVLARYKNYNGLQGNSPVNVTDNNRGNTTLPDVEDINRDNTMDELNAYYEYHIEVAPGMDVGVTPYVTSVLPTIGSTPGASDGETTPARWIQFKIPISQFEDKVGAISDFTSIRFMRMFMTGFSKEITVRFGALDLVRGEWRRYTNTLDPNETTADNNLDTTDFDVQTVNIEENSERVPVKYVSPPGVVREQLYNNNTVIPQNEQALALRIAGTGLEEGPLGGDSRAVFKNVSVDMRQFKKLKMFIHAEALPEETVSGTGLRNNEMAAFIRFGNDFTENFYQIEIPLEVTPEGASIPEIVWPEANNIDVPLALLTQLKILSQKHDFAPQEIFFMGENELDNSRPNKLRIGIRGNPNFGLVRTLMIGMKNNTVNGIYPDGVVPPPRAVKGEVWFNELRIADMDNKGGMAAVVNIDGNIADFATISATGKMSTVGFGTLEQGPNERSREDLQQYNIVTNLNLGKLAPKKWGVTLPFNYAIGEETITPEYDPFNQDIKLDQLLDVTEDAAERKNIKDRAIDYTKRQSINFIGVRKERAPDQKQHIYDPENLTFSHSYNEVNRHNFEIESFRDQQVNTTVDYAFTFQPKPLEPLKKYKFMKKSDYWKLLSDFNFNYLPSNISFSTNIIRQYNKQTFRQVDVEGVPLDALYRRNFLFNYQYGFNYNLTKALKINYTATSSNIIRNYLNENNEPDNTIGIWDDYFNIGDPNQHTQQFVLNYDLPINKIPVFSFIKSTYSYTGDYSWQRASMALSQIPIDGVVYDLGNTIQNAASHKLNTTLNMDAFYKYVGLTKKTKKAPAKPVVAPKPGEKITNTAVEPTNNGNIFVNGLLGILTSVKNIQVNYTQNDGTVLPGFTQGLGFFGSSKPTLGFIFGSQDDVRYEAARRGWLTTYQDFNQNYTEITSKTLNMTASVDLFPDFKIDLNADRTYVDNYSEQYDVDPETGQYNSRSPYSFGNFSITTVMLKTAFKTSDEINSSAFEDLKNNRIIIANRLADSFYGAGNVPRYGDAANPIPTDPLDPRYANRDIYIANQGYPIGFGKNNQAVLLPSFLAAYTGAVSGKAGDDASGISLKAFRDIPIPNWTIKYNGLMRYKFFKDKFKRFSLQNSYKASYTINAFRSNFEYDKGQGGYVNDAISGERKLNVDAGGNLYNKTIISNINLVEQFNPLMRVDFELKNSIKFLAEMKKDRAMSMSFDNNLLTEVKGVEYVLGLGYRIKDVIISSKMADNPSGVIKSDINLKADVSYRNSETIVRYLDYNNNQLSGGQNLWSAKLTADYSFSKNLTAIFYYDHSFSKAVISTSFPITNIRAGFTLRYNFGN
ncbi:cell surface protein SprA [Flavobacterium noncentrifugens]|uniref:Cell surface protein SprA n=1 Tax=Flavobacterium noncentrifugens TaxID=1128970 RepID=A0A1G8RWQ0_9FLAO|nr:cell surface protein SprA [Flavobacterium noncentrifugens]SDJ21421.1 cell surface protein SprA [Flavobacterium noncentrifugens]